MESIAPLRNGGNIGGGKDLSTRANHTNTNDPRRFLWGLAFLSEAAQTGWRLTRRLAAGYAALYYPVALDLWRKLLARWRSQLEDLLSRTVQQRATYDWQQQRSHGASGGGKRQQQRPWSQSEEQQGTSMDPLGLYSKLGVDRTASMDEIKAAFRGLALKYHPDRYGPCWHVARSRVCFASFRPLCSRRHGVSQGVGSG